jgi:short-subunit dehydrogenase
MVVGASGGIGQGFADQLAARGHELILVARDRDRLDELAARLRATHRVTVDVVAADLAREESLRALEERIRADAELELLVNAAGIASWGRFADLDVERELDVIRVNVLAVVRLTRAALDTMLPRRRGAIVTVASLGGYIPLPFCATYGGTKAYLVNFTEALYEELRGSGVRIQVVCPGFTRTEMFARSGADAARMPSYIWAEPDTIARSSLAALRRDRPVCIPGARLRIFSMLVPFLSRAELRRRAGKFFGNFETYRLKTPAESSTRKRVSP